MVENHFPLEPPLARLRQTSGGEGERQAFRGRSIPPPAIYFSPCQMSMIVEGCGLTHPARRPSMLRHAGNADVRNGKNYNRTPVHSRHTHPMPDFLTRLGHFVHLPPMSQCT